MIGTLPVAGLAPQEYRNGLDAAGTLLSGQSAVLVVCRAPELAGEVYQRFSPAYPGEDIQAGLWGEPMLDSWQTDLQRFTHLLHPGDLLVVLASLPLARQLPERRGWKGKPLCQSPAGLLALRRALRESGFQQQAWYGFHTPLAVSLSFLSSQAERWGRPAWGDRLQFAARLRYSTSGVFSLLSTVVLIAARKKLI